MRRDEPLHPNEARRRAETGLARRCMGLGFGALCTAIVVGARFVFARDPATLPHWGELLALGSLLCLLSEIFYHFARRGVEPAVDVTARERALREAVAAAESSRAKLGAILGSLAEGVVVCEADGTFVALNHAAQEVGGSITTTRVGQNVHDYKHRIELRDMKERPVPFEEWPMSRALRGEAFSDCVLWFRRKDIEGPPAIVSYSGRAVRDALGRVELGVVTARNVTAERRAHEDREQLLESERAARAEAERASRLKDEFLATVSHELRTPLTAISGWTQMLRKPGRPADQIARGLEVIDRNSLALTQLISDLLDVGRIVSGKLKLDVCPAAIEEVIDGAVESVRHAADAKGIRLGRQIEPKMGPILGDPARLQQIVWNLLSNAIKFTPRGGSVVVGCETADGHVAISVADSGQGIATEFLPYVFERFRQADASAARQHGGLGLGLAIVRHLVELHGGRARAESEGPGKGARFVVELPLVLPSEASTESSPSLNVERRISTPSSQKMMFGPQDLVGARILIVEDEADTRELVRRLLEEYEVSVVAASSAAEALVIVGQTPLDVLVSDLGMPGMDGFALIREIRLAHAMSPKVLPAVAVTAFARPEDKRRALASGYQAHVEKPIDPATLLATLSGLFFMRKAAAAEAEAPK